MIDDARDLISEKDYQKADDILYKIKNFLEPSTLTWPIILEAALIKNRIHLEKSEDAREAKNWDAAQKHLDDFKKLATIKIGIFKGIHFLMVGPD